MSCTWLTESKTLLELALYNISIQTMKLLCLTLKCTKVFQFSTDAMVTLISKQHLELDVLRRGSGLEMSNESTKKKGMS